jgi:RNA polymerase sigma factor (sigma-70 family)
MRMSSPEEERDPWYGGGLRWRAGSRSWRGVGDGDADRGVWERAAASDAGALGRIAGLAAGIARAELARRGAPRGEMEDLVQDVVGSTLAYVGRGGPAPKDLSSFLKYRAWGVLSDFRKRLRARPMQRQDEGTLERLDPGGGPDASAERRQVLAALADCRSRLDAAQRATIELRYLEGLEGAAIAERLGVHRNTVHVRVHRALIALRECLERKGLTVEDARP